MSSCPKIGIKIHNSGRGQTQLTPYQPPAQAPPRSSYHQHAPKTFEPAPRQQSYQQLAQTALVPRKPQTPTLVLQQPQQQQQPFYSFDEYMAHHQNQITHHQQQMQYHQELLKKYQQTGIHAPAPAPQPQPPPQQRALVPHQGAAPPQQQRALVPHHPTGPKTTTAANPFDAIDLNIDNYKLEDILTLFNITDPNLTDEVMKKAKRDMLKLHPDKCQNRLDPKYYEFFKKAYNYLEQVHQFQNRSENRAGRSTDYSAVEFHDEDNSQLVKDFFHKQGGGGFSNKAFNEQFEKVYVPDEAAAKGYDDWFKSDEGIIGQPEGKIGKGAINSHIENYKRELGGALMKYTGVADHIYTGTAAGGAVLNVGAVDNFTGSSTGDIFSGRGLVFTDLKQAYTETLIPIAAEDEYEKTAKYRNVNEYQSARDMDAKTYKVMSDAELKAYIAEQERRAGHEGAAVAFQFAKQNEKAQAAQTSFWSNLKQLTYGGG